MTMSVHAGVIYYDVPGYKADEVAIYFHDEESCNVGKLVRPTSKDYNINKCDNSGKFLELVSNYESKAAGVWEICSTDELQFEIIYEENKYHMMNIGFRIFDNSFNMYRLGIGKDETIRKVWCELIRQGFRPSSYLFL